MKKVFIVFICILLCGCASKEIENVDYDSINNFNYDSISQYDGFLHSKEHLLVRMSDLNVLLSKDADKKIYPASLTKLMTLDTVLNCFDDFSSTSSFTYEQFLQLIDDDASLAGLDTDYEYTIEELLYALILPSGADGAVALENYFKKNGLNLAEEMNKQLKQLGCNDTNFVNTTGLHDDEHYTTLNDLFKIVMDVLSFEEGRKILETTRYRTSDGIILMSSLKFTERDDVTILGGKTGFTTESGESVLVLFKKNNRSYILIVANAEGNPYEQEFFHFEDVMEIISTL